MKFCCNISFMFTENSFLERYKLAKLAGFKCVESGFPFGIDLKDVVAAKKDADIEQVLINTYTGDVTKGEVGFAAIPGKEKEFSDSLDMTIKYAEALNCKKIHIMSGKVNGPRTEEHDKVFLSNLSLAATKLRNKGITGLIEPINNYSVPDYFLNSYKQGIDVLTAIGSPHTSIRLMVDVFHMQQIQGNITRSLKEYFPLVGHVQIAQVPNRNEPNTDGEIDYKFVLNTLKELGYNDWIGLEYKPVADPMKGLSWINEYGYSL